VLCASLWCCLVAGLSNVGWYLCNFGVLGEFGLWWRFVVLSAAFRVCDCWIV